MEYIAWIITSFSLHPSFPLVEFLVIHFDRMESPLMQCLLKVDAMSRNRTNDSPVRLYFWKDNRVVSKKVIGLRPNVLGMEICAYQDNCISQAVMNYRRNHEGCTFFSQYINIYVHKIIINWFAWLTFLQVTFFRQKLTRKYCNPIPPWLDLSIGEYAPLNLWFKQQPSVWRTYFTTVLLALVRISQNYPVRFVHVYYIPRW